jgi:hypothetical protein
MSSPSKATCRRTKPTIEKINTVKNIRSYIKTLISDLREIKRNKSVSCLFGQGHTIAVKGGISTISRQGKGFNFSGSWNRGVSYWTEEVATKGAAQLRSSLPFEIEVIHHNDIRDRHEAFAKNAICSFFKHRNS